MAHPGLSLKRILVLPLLLAISLGCSEVDNLLDNEEEISPAREAAEMFQSKIDVSATSEVLFVGPVEPGTILLELHPLDTLAAQIILPDSVGTTYAFFVDDAPGMKRDHPYRYYWFDIDNGTSGTVAAGFDGRIVPPDSGEVGPFVEKEAFMLGDVGYTHVEGEGALDSLGTDHRPPFMIPPDDELPRSFAIPRALRKRALVIDGGDKSNKQTDAKNMHELDAKPIAKWVTDEGFTTRHVSQWSGATGESFKPTISISTVRNAILFAIEDYGKFFTNLKKPDNGCDEFFLYISSHAAGRGNIAVYHANGKDAAVFGFDEIYTRIENTFPKWVKVTCFFDACYSGQAITKNREKIMALCDKLCSFTVITASDSVKTTPVPGAGDDSATEDFMEGANQDHDGDGNKGDIQDRFLEMKNELGNRGPMSFHCPENTSWCSLDGPQSTSSACLDLPGTYFCSVTETEDPAGHGEFIGDPFADNPIIFSDDGTLRATGNAPFVDVTGSADAECSFNASGIGTVAGFENILVTMSGQYADGDITFQYTMGAKGGLPTGQPISYFCTGTMGKRP